MDNSERYGDLLTHLKEYSKENRVPMHMPGAKRNSELINRYMSDISNPYEIDITEIDGFDNMHNAEGIIKNAFDKAARLYGADESLFLVNGSTAGNMSAICGVTKKGDSIIVARNCHISVYNAIILNELDAIYVYPQYDSQYGYYKGITLEEIKYAVEKNSNKEIKAVVITSPTYEGNVSEIKEITEYLHSYNIPLIVDEAHGAHFKFSGEFPVSAVSCGADIVINSVHKTLPSLTQTAVMHINYGIVNVEKIKRYWNMYQSTSPSYILMGSIDRCMSIIETDGEYLFKNYIIKLKELRNKLKTFKNIKLIETDDISKIVLGCDDAKKLYEILLSKYGIQLEMSSIKYVIAMTSVFDSKEYYDRLYKALCDIEKNVDKSLYDIEQDIDKDFNERYNNEKYDNMKYNDKNICDDINLNNMQHFNYDIENKCAMGISEALNICDDTGYDVIMMNNDELYGRISAKMVYVYPPGIPILCPGEIISKKVVDVIRYAVNAGLEIVGIKGDYNVKNNDNVCKGAFLCLR